jgi:hypothetical protein
MFKAIKDWQKLAKTAFQKRVPYRRSAPEEVLELVNEEADILFK